MIPKPLIEEYRPQSFDEVVGVPQEIVDMVKNKNMPHLLFQGPPGTGKTTVAKIIAKELDAEILLLNASKDRGIDVIRNQIYPFTRVMNDKLKIVFLDECDYTTPQFQVSLRNLMEEASDDTRFIGTCNYPEKIIPELKSRYTIFTFKNHKKEDIVERLKFIVASEQIKIESDDLFGEIADIYKDDIRGMVNFLQKNKYSTITKDNIEKVSVSALDVMKNVKNIGWSKTRADLFNYDYLDHAYMVKEMDKIIFYNSKIDDEKKRQFNAICCRYMDMMTRSMDKEIIFAGFMGEIEPVLRVLGK
jgi:DNA polymerase III delta prime subunit